MFFGRKKLLSLPRWVQIEPTNLCNQKCVMCPRNTHSDSPQGQMSFNDFKIIYRQIPTINDLQLNGLGEPLINEEIFQMIKYAKKHGSTVSLTSNCELISEDKAVQLIESGLDILKISMDSADPAIYSLIRNGNLARAVAGIKNMIEAKKRLRRDKPLLWFNSILMANNYKWMFNVMELGNNLGIDYIRFKPVDTFNIYKEKDLIIPEENLFVEIINTIEKSQGFLVKHNLRDLLSRRDIYYKPRDIKYPCYSPWLEVYIQWYGGVRLCCEFYSSKHDVGNIFQDDFRTIWNNAIMKGIRSLFLQGQMNFPVCQTCNRFQRNILIYNKIKSKKLWK